MVLECITIQPKQSAEASIIWLHGLGADGHDFVDIIPELGLPLDHQFRFIFPHAPIRPVTVNGHLPTRAWYDILSLGNLDREDLLGMKETRTSVNDLIRHEIASGIPSNRILLAGFSQGGAMALFAGLCFSERLAGIVSLSAYLPAPDVVIKEQQKVNQSTPILLAHGDYDDVIPARLSVLAEQRLKAMGYSVDLYHYPMGHQVNLEEIQLIGRWIQQRLLV